MAAVFLGFGKNAIDFAQLVKEYSRSNRDEHRYSPPEIIKS